MQTIGLIGGMSWESTQVYYRLVNQLVAKRLGGLHSARLWLHSVDFAAIEELQRRAAWDEAGEMLAQAAQPLEAAGADCLVLCTNTMHIVADRIERACSIPLLHIADATADRIHQHALRKVALLGTRFTMEKPFYVDRLRMRHGVDVVVPDERSRAEVHRIIYEELCCGRIEEASRHHVQRIIEQLAQHGAQGVILGCTELPLLLTSAQSALPVFDTTLIHAEAAVSFALG